MADRHSSPFERHPQSSLSKTEEELEAEHFISILRAFASYERSHNNTILKKYKHDWNLLSASHQEILSAVGYQDKLRKTEDLIRINQEFFNFIIAPHIGADMGEELLDGGSQKVKTRALTSTESDNLRSLLRTICRDWSRIGQSERDACYQPILNTLETTFQNTDQRSAIKVLVPGAGLGRLAYEISRMGFSVEGNEFSLFMLLTSEAMLNRNLLVDSLSIYPYVLPFANVIDAPRHCHQPIRIPDVRVCSPPNNASFSMVAGDMLEVYSNPDQEGAWDVIVTCFFIDTAKNIIEYLELFRRLLKPGGRWINLGPLLYHFEGHHQEVSIELSQDEIRKLMEHFGFEITSEAMHDTAYAQNPNSMYQTTYRSWFFSAHRKN